jgi:hypothetical protein
MTQNPNAHTYRLQLAADGKGEAHEIEFEALGSNAALNMAHATCGSRSVTVFEDGRKLADIKYNQGFWHVS